MQLLFRTITAQTAYSVGLSTKNLILLATFLLDYLYSCNYFNPVSTFRLISLSQIVFV